MTAVGKAPGPDSGCGGGADPLDVLPAASESAGGAVVNEISGGVFLSPVIQGHTVILRLPPTVTPASGGLPPATPVFTGRDVQLKEIHGRLAPQGPDTPGGVGVAVTVLVGLGGVGKTELALQAAHRAVAEPGWFPGGLLFVDLFGYDDERRLSPEQALDTLLRYLAVPVQHIPVDLQGRSALYRTILKGYADQGRRVLVILDNASSTDQVRPLLPSDSDTPVLLTSRHTLTFHLGERLYDLDVLDSDDGVELIRRLLEQARPGDARAAVEPTQAARIVELCAGLPLALWVATALLTEAPSRPLANLAQALEDSHRRLERLSRRSDKAVRASFDLSYQALSPQHARLFRFLSLNPGPDLSTEAAACLLDEDLFDVQDLLDDLALAHLIGPGASYGRWRMHDLVRLFAHERGNAQAGADRPLEAASRLFDHYRLTTEAADTLLGPGYENPGRFADLAQALNWLDTEHPNLIATVQTAYHLGHADTSYHLAFALTRYLKRRRHLDDWIKVSATAAALCHLHGPEGGTALALSNYGVALAEARRFDEAVKAHGAALAIKRRLNDQRGVARTLSNIATTWHEMRRFEDAVSAYMAAARIFGELGHHRGQAHTLTNLAALLNDLRRFDQALAVLSEVADLTQEGNGHDITGLMARGAALAGKRRFDEAIEVFNRAADIHRRNADHHEEANTLNHIGNAMLQAWRVDEAIKAHTRAAELLQKTGDLHGEATARNSLGLCLRQSRRLSEAAEAHTRAAEAFHDTGDRNGEGLARTNLGMVLVALGRPDQAVDEHTRAAKLLRKTSDPNGEGIALNNLGCALRRVGEFAGALAAHDRAAELFRQTGDRKSEADVLNNVGTARREMGQFKEAIDANTAAAALYREVSDRHGEAEASTKIAEALLETGRFEEAAHASRRAAEILRKTEDRYGTAVAYGNLGVALIGLGSYREAVDACEKAVHLFRELDCSSEETTARRYLFHAAGELKKPD
ncbi:tetratricopeptide repeat protein [Streptomyces montanus]|uniref:tetratricopeptide repeat protein n=1 Tax=Streptomyces montanus TaxID=2580423 RepID=UPI001486AC9F|nr:tetratricopeptide repeat protein [Streptomyces montanus]